MVGKVYEMDNALHAGVAKRKAEKNARFGDGYNTRGAVAKVLEEAIKQKKDGALNVELLGQVKAIYAGSPDKVAYQITPNSIWKV